MNTRITWFFLLAANVTAFNVRPSVVHHGRFSVSQRMSDEATETVTTVTESTQEDAVAADAPLPEVETSDEVADSGEGNASTVKTERYTIYFGNLPYSATVKDLKAMIGEVAEVRFVNLPKDKESDRIRGFGFVDVGSEDDIPKVVDAFNGFELDGRSLRVSRSLDKDKIRGTKREVSTAEGCTKLYVGNLSFTTTMEDLSEYLKEFGEIEDIFFPQDNSGRPRGFAFISVKDEDVEAVLEGTNGIEFMGRVIAVNHPLPPGEKGRRQQTDKLKIYVGNLAFFTSSETVFEVFSEFGQIYDVYIPTDIETERSRGFGFVSMEAEAGRAAIDALDECELDGRIISVNEARPRGEKTRQVEEEEEEAYEESI